jgi:hypothetical protein
MSATAAGRPVQFARRELRLAVADRRRLACSRKEQLQRWRSWEVREREATTAEERLRCEAEKKRAADGAEEYRHKLDWSAMEYFSLALLHHDASSRLRGHISVPVPRPRSSRGQSVRRRGSRRVTSRSAGGGSPGDPDEPPGDPDAHLKLWESRVSPNPLRLQLAARP